MPTATRAMALTVEDVEAIDASSSDPNLISMRFGVSEQVVLAIHKGRWVSRDELTGLSPDALHRLVCERIGEAREQERQRRVAQRAELRRRVTQRHALAREAVTRVEQRPDLAHTLGAPRRSAC